MDEFNEINKKRLKRSRSIVGVLLLIIATICWGTSFLILKQTIENTPSFYVLALRFLSSGILFALIFIKRIKRCSKGAFIRGIMVGLIVATAYVLQTLGLQNTTPSRNAFLTSTYSVMCPFAIWIIYKRKPSFKKILASVICVVGIGLISVSQGLGETSNWFLGEGLTLCSAVFFALQIIVIDRAGLEKDDSLAMISMELLICGIIFTVLCCSIEIPVYGIQSFALDKDQIWRIVYLTLAPTVIAQFAQIVGQKYVSPTRSAILLSLEAVFGAMFSCIFGEEELSVMLVIGFVLVFSAVILSQIYIPKKRAEGETEKTDGYLDD